MIERGRDMKMIITGSSGLVGSEAALYFADKGYKIVGIDNDMRAKFFGPDASTKWMLAILRKRLKDRYVHYNANIKHLPKTARIYRTNSKDLKFIFLVGSLRSSDWAAQ